MLRCRVLLLDDTYIERELEKNAVGQVLFDNVCAYLNLLERDYFGLAPWESSNTKMWLDVSKKVRKQVTSQQATFTFGVKFYPPDPSLLTEDITRYLLCLQLRMDIMTGRLPCPPDTAAVLGSYTVQSEFGDYDPGLHGQNFLTNIPLAPDQTPELEEKVKELHYTHECMSPALADKLFLQTARTLPFYGVHLHPAKDVSGADVMLGVCADGLLEYEDGENTQSFPWPKVLKMSYKRNNFQARIRRTQDSSETTISYSLSNHRACKCLWKNAVEHHAFFRNHRPDKATEGLLHFGSRFRLHGLTYGEALAANGNITREALRFSHSAIKRRAKDSMFVALKRPNRTEIDDWFQILASDQRPTYTEFLDVGQDEQAETERAIIPDVHKELVKDSDLEEENTWFELLSGNSSLIQLPSLSVSDNLDSTVINVWEQADDDWFVLLEPSTPHSEFLPMETPQFGEVIEWEEVTREENVKIVKIRKEVQSLRQGNEKVEDEARPSIAGELDSETNHELMQIIEEKTEEKGNGDETQNIVVFQQRTLEEEKYMGRPQEVYTEHRIRRVEIVRKMHELASDESEIITEGTIEELQKRLLEVEAFEQNLQDIEKLNLSLQKLQAWQQQLEPEGQPQGEKDDWYLLLDLKPVEVSSAPEGLQEIEFQTPEATVVEEIQIMEDKVKQEEEGTRRVKEWTPIKMREESRKELNDGWFALLDLVSPTETVVYDQEVTGDETGPVMEKVTSITSLIYEEKAEERRERLVETYSKVAQKNRAVQHETDDWFVLLEPVCYGNRIIPSAAVAKVQGTEESIEEKPVIIKEVQTKVREAGDVEAEIPVGTREVDDSWFVLFDQTPFEKRSVPTAAVAKVQETEESIEEKPVIIKEVQTKVREAGEVEAEIPVGTREVDDSWFLHFDQTPFEKRSVPTDNVLLPELYEDLVALRTQQRLTIKEKEVTTEEKKVIIREVQMKTGEVEKKIPVVRREVDDSWFVLFDQTPFEKRRIVTVPLTEAHEGTAGLRTQQRVTIKPKERTKEGHVILTEERAIAEEVERKIPATRRKVDDGWFVLLDPTPFEKRRVVAELLQEDTVRWRKRKVEDKQSTRVKESVVSPVDVPKVRPQPPADQPMTSTPTAQTVRITSPSYQDESLTRLTITQDVTHDISQESKMETESVLIKKRKEKKIEGETIYIRHSILMLEDFDVTQEVVLRHHASISELKRLFMEDLPICVPTEWEKRLSTHTPVIIPQLSNGQLVLA